MMCTHQQFKVSLVYLLLNYLSHHGLTTFVRGLNYVMHLLGRI